MLLTRHLTERGPAWCLDGHLLSYGYDLSSALSKKASELENWLRSIATREACEAPILPPIDDRQEVWASGVTYLRSRVEREAESTVADVYAKVYEAPRPELFFKSAGWRVKGPKEYIRVRKDSNWNVPEPELVLVANRFGEIIGYTAGNDVSSRSIEGENPLYLPQAKTYDGSCALGPGIVLCSADEMRSLNIHLTISRDGQTVFDDETSIDQMKRSLEELVGFLFSELSFPNGALLMTGTGIVPAHPFTLHGDDEVTISIGSQILTNTVQS